MATPPLSRRRFVALGAGALGAGALAGAARAAEAGRAIPLMYVSEQRAAALREAFAGGEPEAAAVAARLRERAEAALPRGPWSVTFDPSPAVSGDSHDYFSEGPYWWPDPRDPQAPYIRRDGEVNPDRFTAHREGMDALVAAVRDLGLAAFYLDQAPYAERAWELLRVWFVASETRMAPHLEYGQAIRGRCDGRGTGIIDTVTLIGLVHALTHLSRAPGRQPAVLDGVAEWFGQYLTWLTTSRKGLDEKRAPNNHGTYWAAQVATYAGLTGDEALIDEVEAEFREVLVPHQIEPDGRCPQEEARTRSLSYSLYNADAFALICELAYHRGTNLWEFETEDGRGVRRVVDYLAPYVTDPGNWAGQQIAGVSASRKLFLQLGAVRLGEPAYLARMERLEPGQCVLGPLELLAGGLDI